MSKPHTILGAGGAIANNLVPILLENGEKVRLVSRSGKSQKDCETRKADVLDKLALKAALEGSSIVYLLIGIEYNIKQWQQKWPVIMQNALDICSELNIPLIFFDNVYMYGRVRGEMTEETPFKPVSKKGEVRAHIATMLLDAVKAGNVKATIARSADFYGPYSQEVSFFHQLLLVNQLKGKKGQLMISADQPHSMTYTRDAAAGIYAIAKDTSAYNQTWHLPTASPALTGKELGTIAAKYTGSPEKLTVLSRFMIKLAGLFIPAIKESIEMLYQFDSPYHFNSKKFEKHFGILPTSYEEGLKRTIEFYRSHV